MKLAAGDLHNTRYGGPVKMWRTLVYFIINQRNELNFRVTGVPID